MTKQPKFAVGTKFIPRSGRKEKRVETVIDIHTTYNLAGEAVKMEYICEHDFLGQKVVGRFVEVSIQLGKLITSNQ